MGIYLVVFSILLLIDNSGGSEVITVDVHKAKELLHSANYAYLDVRYINPLFLSVHTVA